MLTSTTSIPKKILAKTRPPHLGDEEPDEILNGGIYNLLKNNI